MFTFKGSEVSTRLLTQFISTFHTSHCSLYFRWGILPITYPYNHCRPNTNIPHTYTDLRVVPTRWTIPGTTTEPFNNAICMKIVTTLKGMYVVFT